MIAEALKQAKVIESDDLNVLVSSKVCEMSSRKCMYGECTKCKGRLLTVDKENLDKDITWYEWKTKKEVRNIKKNKDITEKTITITVKESQTGPAVTLIDRFEEQLNR
ncbi:hypothetical protein DPMN_061163 [Dreissena polymorpha]|uniref:Uncharacterized protein n=1 Tax=Dreissena polymorpha TaxID=45954 RepID=A0A9D4C6Y0_DREPO|nr:hypothetical protein DPMN_061163 [Dreissena polymorpha]